MAANAAERESEIREGKKTFFVCPDPELMPGDLPRSLFLKGFEAYFLPDTSYDLLGPGLKALVDLFPETNLFINIDHVLPGIEWPRFIAALQRSLGSKAGIGVLYADKPGVDVASLERRYLYELGLTCGCIPLERRKALNLPKLLGVLIANQAVGRRKFLRMGCPSGSTGQWSSGGSRYTARIHDLSTSHFSCWFPSRDPELPIFKQIDEISLEVGSTKCRVSARISTKRVVAGQMLYVFVFRDLMGNDGLEPATLSLVNGLVFDSYRVSVMGLLERNSNGAFSLPAQPPEGFRDVDPPSQENPSSNSD